MPVCTSTRLSIPISLLRGFVDITRVWLGGTLDGSLGALHGEAPQKFTNKDDARNKDNLKNEDDLKDEGNIKNEDSLEPS